VLLSARVHSRRRLRARRDEQFDLEPQEEVDRRSRPEWTYKERAIQQAGNELRQVLLEELRAHRERLTIVPMPPSRIQTNPLYDDRMRRIIDVMTEGLDSDVRELVLQARDMPAAHEAAGAGRTRSRPEDWYAVYYARERCP
jgi:hypothetical protein